MSLSDKIYCKCGKELDHEQCKLGYSHEDVKEAVKELKEDIEDSGGEFLNDEMIKELNKVIDKIFGDKLI